MSKLQYNNINLEPMTIQNLVDSSIKNYPQRPSLAFYDQKPITYATIGKKIKLTAIALDLSGIKPGDKVAIIGESSPEWVCAYLGIIYRGAIAVPILPDFPSEDINNIFKHSESKIAFCSSRQIQKLQESHFAPKIPLIILDNSDLNLKKFNSISGFYRSKKIRKHAILHHL